MQSLPEIEFKDSKTSKYGIEIKSFAELLTTDLKGDHSPFEPHRLKFNVVLFIEDGPPGLHNVDFKNYELDKNQILLIAKEQVHCFVDLIKNSKGILLLFNPNYALGKMSGVCT